MHRVDIHSATIELPLERSPRFTEPVTLFADLPREARLVDREVDGDDDEEMFRPFEL